MTIEKDVLLSLLRLTRSGPAQKELLVKNAKIPTQTAELALKKLSSQGDFFREQKNVIEASSSQRVKMAVYALRLAADFERVCSLLSWTEFESIAAQAFEANGYRVMKNFRFKQASRKWEIDVIGFKKPLILCMDCKHWKRGWQKAATMKAVEAQIERTKAFAEAVPNYYQKVRLNEWEAATIVPIVLSLTAGPYKFYNNVPIVPILQLQDFISELPAHVHLLKSFHQKHVKLNKYLQQFSQ